MPQSLNYRTPDPAPRPPAWVRIVFRAILIAFGLVVLLILLMHFDIIGVVGP